MLLRPNKQLGLGFAWHLRSIFSIDSQDLLRTTDHTSLRSCGPIAYDEACLNTTIAQLAAQDPRLGVSPHHRAEESTASK
jgi:hypothetical protein